MTRPLQIILTFLLALNILGAADLIRPSVELTPGPNGIYVELDFGNVSDAQWKGVLEDPESFHNYGFGVAGEPGEAALPMFTIFVPLLENAITTVSNITRDDVVLPGIAVKAATQGHLDSERQAVEISAYDWDRAARSRTQEIQPGEAMMIRGKTFLPVTIRPVGLNVGSQSIVAPRSMGFELSGVELGDVSNLSEDGGILSVIQPGEQFPSRGHYLIISPPQFIDYIQYFADWKTRMGYAVTIVGTAATGSSASAIKSFIQTAWDTWEDQPDYLVLVGDEDRGIPGHYIQNPQGDFLVTDHPYALLEGDDSFPELMVGRLSVDTITELVSFTAKIVSYESNPEMGSTDWFQRALMISTTWGAASTQATKEWVADKMLENGFNHVYTAYHPEVSTTSAIANPINAGVGFVNYRGFGMYNGWFGPDFLNSDIYRLIHSGTRTPVITSVVCGGGNFAASENDPCFGEVWTRIGTFGVPNGAVAFFGPSELYTHTQFNNVIDIGIYSGIFDQGITTLGEALWNGKFELWRNYHQNTYFPFDQTPEFYHHIYNLLGDPGMQLWTAVPEILSVSHVDTLLAGDNYIQINVTDTLDQPIPGAYVSLSNSENARGGYTDESGQIALPVVSNMGDELNITVTGKNLLPYLASIPVSAGDHALELAAWDFQDGAQPVAGDSTAMVISLNNPGSTLNDVLLTVTSETPGFSLNQSFMLNSIGAQSVVDMDSLRFVAPLLPHGTPMIFELEIETSLETWTWQHFAVLQAPQLSITGLDVVSGSLHAGETVQVAMEVSNTGGSESQPISMTPLPNDLVTFYEGISMAALGVDDTEISTETLEITFQEILFPGENIELSFECIQGDVVDTLGFTVQLDGANRFGPSQRDGYGYRLFDQYDLNYSKAPVFDWLEIDPDLGGNGTMVDVIDNWEEEDASEILNLPFTVNYYGESFDQITVCSNGWAAFGAHEVVNFHNRRIPSPIGPTAMLAPFWDDLKTHLGGVYTKHDAVNDLFIIEWSRVRSLFENADMSFQLVIYGTDETPTVSGDNDIKFQYNEYANLDLASNFATIGIESPNSEMGIQASYNNIDHPSIGEIGNGTALLFTTDRGERLGDSEIAFSTTSLSFEQAPWSSGRDSIMISNSGESPLLYEISYASTLMLAPAPVIPHDPSITKDTPDIINAASTFREGSDEYGYLWLDNTDEGGPGYHWIDIENESNLLPYTSTEYDDCSIRIELGFEFPLYDDVYSVAYMGSNGTITFETAYSPWYNIHLPSGAAPSSIIAPWWDDLNNDTGPQGTFYYWSNDVNQCILTWKNFPKHGTESYYSFQVILDSYGNIKIQYEDMGEIVASSTVGMQNSDRNVGLTVRHNETTPMEGGTAISIQPPTIWFSATGWSGLVGPGESLPFIVDVEPRNSMPGSYETALLVTTTAPNAPETTLNVSLDVVLGETPFGDVNGDYLVNIHDVTVLFDYILMVVEMNDLESEAADLSSDGAVDVRDLILLIEAMNLTNGP